MTLKEAILKSLEEIKELTTYKVVCTHVIKHGYYDFGEAKTPEATVSALLGNFIRANDSRVQRIKKRGAYYYYLTKFESQINQDPSLLDDTKSSDDKSTRSYAERDLHALFATYLKSIGIHSKTIYHEQSKNSSDDHQTWIHPDMVGIKFVDLKTETSKIFLKAINKKDAFKLISYELKKEINSDYELKKYYFQALSNSNWANMGYLVALQINSNLHEEIARLNQAFGIGVIELKPNPFQTKVLYPAKNKELDLRTIDKLCKVNLEFETFIALIEKWIAADERYASSAENELVSSCDNTLKDDQEAQQYCEKKNIPFEEGDFSDETDA